MCVKEELLLLLLIPSRSTQSPRGQSNDRLSPLTFLPQPGQHPPQPGDGPGPGETNPPWDCQQQRTPAHAEHQRRLPVPQNTPAPHRRREAQQGAENMQTQTHRQLSVHALLSYSPFWFVSARRPSCSRQPTTSSPWSRKRHSSWHRTTSSNASSR